MSAGGGSRANVHLLPNFIANRRCCNSIPANRVRKRELPMKHDLEELLLGGYCHLHRNAGPFTIGEDFEAPGPAAGVLPRIKIGRETEDQLCSFVAKETNINGNENSDAEIFDDTMRRLAFVNGVSEALSWYISTRQFQINLPTFREQLKELRRAIVRFQSNVPDEDTPLDHYLRTTYTGEVFVRDHRKPSRRELTALQGRWQRHVGLPAIRDALNSMLRNLEAAQMLIGNRKPRDHQVKRFVQTLAKVWKTATGTWPSSGRNPFSNKQTGRFADFVRATNEILPRTFRIATLDAAIRAACEATNRS
jgi:hypothetical protein